MNAIKLNKFERVAGAFVLIAIMGVILTVVSAAIKQGWFEPKLYYTTTFISADGVHQGTLVQMAGLRVGAVESVDFEKDNQIRVTFFILGKFQDRVREDSTVQLLRPFIIGERVLEISLGSESLPLLTAGTSMKSVESMDIMTLISGKNMNATLTRLTGILESMQVMLEAFADKRRAESLVRVVDRLDPLIRNMNSMSTEVVKLAQQVNRDDSLPKIVSNLAVMTTEINRILPELNKQNPHLGQDLAHVTQNLSVMMAALTPAMKQIEGELPGASSRFIEALNETVVLLKAMQKNYFIKGSVQEVREEESVQQRQPASQKKQK